MPDYAVTLVVAILTLLGTLAGIYAAQRRARSERQREFMEQRQTTYRKLWEYAEDLAVGLRIDEVERDQVSDRIRDLNVLMLKAGPFLDEDDRILTQQYVDEVVSFIDALNSADDSEAKVDVGETRNIPPDVLDRVEVLGTAQRSALAARQRLVKRLRKVLQGVA